MIVVDANAWGDYFNGAHTPHVERLEAALAGEEDVAVLPIILTEVLQGFRTEAGFRRALALLSALPVLEPGVEAHVRAARLLRALRARGVTVRGAVDCLIAQTCLDTDASCSVRIATSRGSPSTLRCDSGARDRAAQGAAGPSDGRPGR